MTKINKQQAAQIAGISQKTLERKINAQTPDAEHFRELTGFHRSANGRIEFDEQKFRQYYAGFAPDQIGIDGSLEVEENIDNIDTPKNGKSDKLVKSENKAVKKSENIDKPRQTEFEKTFILPHKIFLTLREASQLSGLPQAYLRDISQKIGARRLIHRTDLETHTSGYVILRKVKYSKK